MRCAYVGGGEGDGGNVSPLAAPCAYSLSSFLTAGPMISRGTKKFNLPWKVEHSLVTTAGTTSDHKGPGASRVPRSIPKWRFCNSTMCAEIAVHTVVCLRTVHGSS